TWKFTLDNTKPATQALNSGDTIDVSFSYTLKDADGDTVTKEVSFAINGANDTAGVSFDAGTGPDAGKVYEHGLESVADASETTGGKITVTATDGVASVTLGTDAYDLAHLDGQTVDTGKGVLTVTGHTVSADGKTVEITYSYTLSAAQTHADGAGNNTVQDSIAVGVTGAGGSTDSGTLHVTIVDDVPVAADHLNVGTVTEDAPTNHVEGSVLGAGSGSDYGADGAAASGALAWGTAVATKGSATVNLSDYGHLDQNPDGTWKFTLDNTKPATQALNSGDTIDVSFSYTLKDKDGDTVTKEVSFAINGANDTAGVSFDAGTGPDAGKVYEHGLESVADTSETTGGKITVTATDGVASVTLGTDTYDLAHLDGQTV